VIGASGRLVLALVVAAAGACRSAAPSAPVDIPVPVPQRPLSELARQLRAADAPSRAAAAWSLAGAGEIGEELTHSLVALLDDPSAPVREAATWALSHVDSAGFDRRSLYDEAPRPIAMAKPRYPQRAYEKRIEGTVLTEILISETGSVAHSEIRRSIPGLDEAALATVREWRFTPAKRGGKPVACTAKAPVTFRIY
jgi:protein TonB